MSTGAPNSTTIIHIPVLDAYYTKRCRAVDVLFDYSHQEEPTQRLHELVHALETDSHFNKRTETPPLLKLAKTALETKSVTAVEQVARPTLQIPVTPRTSSLQKEALPTRQVSLNHYLSDLLNDLQEPLEDASLC